MGSYEHAPSDKTEFSHAGVTAGQLPKGGKTYGICVGRFNGKITRELYRGAVQALLDAGIEPDKIAALSVAGAIELPYAAQALAKSPNMKAVIMLGAVIRGETPHFDYVCRIAADGARQVMLEEHIPVGFGVLTTDTVEQAMDRAGDRRNAGADAAAAVLDLVQLSEAAGTSKVGLGFS